MRKTTPGPWELQAGRTIVTPSGTFYLSYSTDNCGRAAFPNYCELDRNAQAIAALPDLLDALEAFVTQATKVAGFPQAYEPYAGPLALARAAIRKATDTSP